MLSYRLDAKWNLTAGIDLTHYSNGNTALPNPGVNTLGGRVGVTYTLNGDRRTGALADNFEIEPMKPHLSYDLVVYGAVRKKVADLNGPEELPGHFGIAGLNFAPMYNFNRFCGRVSRSMCSMTRVRTSGVIGLKGLTGRR